MTTSASRPAHSAPTSTLYRLLTPTGQAAAMVAAAFGAAVGLHAFAMSRTAAATQSKGSER